MKQKAPSKENRVVEVRVELKRSHPLCYGLRSQTLASALALPMIRSYNPDPFGKSLLGSFENLASIPCSILCCLILAFSFLSVTRSFVRPSFSPLFPASHSDNAGFSCH